MGQILVRNIEDSVLAAVKRRAKANQRSMSAEIRAILKQVATSAQPVGDRPRRSILDFAGIAPSNRTVEEIVADIRKLRDEWDR